MSTLGNIYPNFIIYVHILEYMSMFSSKYPHFQKYVHLMKYMPFCLITIQCLYFDTNLCLAHITKEALQIKLLVTKKRRGRSKTKQINNRFITRLIVCSRCQKDRYNRRTCNAISYSQLDKSNISFSNILSTLIWFCPLFDIVSAFPGIYLHFRIFVPI